MRSADEGSTILYTVRHLAVRRLQFHELLSSASLANTVGVSTTSEERVVLGGYPVVDCDC